MKIQCFLIIVVFQAEWTEVRSGGGYPTRISDNLNGVMSYGEMKGATYTYNVMVAGNAPYTLAILVKGNGVHDELQLQVNSLSEVEQLEILNQRGKITFKLPIYYFGAISKSAGTLIVVDHGLCTLRKYDSTDPRRTPKQEALKEAACKKVMSEIGL